MIIPRNFTFMNSASVRADSCVEIYLKTYSWGRTNDWESYWKGSFVFTCLNLSSCYSNGFRFPIDLPHFHMKEVICLYDFGDAP